MLAAAKRWRWCKFVHAGAVKACGVHAPNPAVERTSNGGPIFCDLEVSVGRLRPLSYNVGPSTSCQSSSSKRRAFVGKAAGEKAGLAGQKAV